MKVNDSERYYRRKFTGGKSRLGRAIDFLALRLVLFLALWLFFRPRVPVRNVPLLLAAITLTAGMLIMRVVRELRFRRFHAREQLRIRDELIREKLMLLPENAFRLLVSGLTGQYIRAVPLQCAEPADANAVLAALKDAEADEKLAIFSTGGYTKSAEAFARAHAGRVSLVPPERLAAAVAESPLVPNAEEIEAYVRAELAAKKRKKRVRTPKPAPGTAKKYVVSSLLLTGASFLTGYAVYYRLLAGLCMLFAVAAFAASERTHANAG